MNNACSCESLNPGRDKYFVNFAFIPFMPGFSLTYKGIESWYIYSMEYHELAYLWPLLLRGIVVKNILWLL